MGNLAERIDAQKAKLATLVAERATQTTEIGQLRTKLEASDSTVTPEIVTTSIEARQAKDAEIDTAQTELRGLEDEMTRDKAMEELQRQFKPAGNPSTDQRGSGYEKQHRVTNEPTAYSRENAQTVSFFRDAFSITRGGGGRDAKERMERNEREVAALPQAAEQMQRATTTASYSGLVVPQYLVDMAANVLRNGRPMANACTGVPIPEQGMSFILPVAGTGVTVASQAAENTAASNTNQVWNNVTIPVGSIMGQQQVSRQTLDRGTPGIDSLIYNDLAAAYMAELDRQIFVGTGASGQITGILGTSGIYKATPYGAVITTSTFYSKTAGAIAGIAGAGTAIRPQYIVMHPRRWGWLTLQVDSYGRPLVVPNQNGPYNALGLNSNPGSYGGDGDPTQTVRAPEVVGTLQGIPVFTDANVPTTLGGGNTEDTHIVFDPRMAILFEDGDGMPRQLSFDQIQVSGVAGWGGTVTLAVYNYVAFTAARYPQAFAQVGGLDLTANATYGQQAPTY